MEKGDIMSILGDLDIQEVGYAINFDKVVAITGYELDVKEESAKADAKLAKAKGKIADAIIAALESATFTVAGVTVEPTTPAPPGASA